MSDVSYPCPDNVRGKFGRWVTADMFHIAQRIQEVDPTLFIQVLDSPMKWADQTWNFIIVEVPETGPLAGIECWVYPTEALDGRVIEHVQRMLAVPFDKRFEEAEKLEAKREADDQERQMEEALDGWGWDFRKQLAHDGFISHTGKSYSKRGVATHGLHARG